MSDVTMNFCNAEWMAPRGDVPVSVDVNHVCALVEGHAGAHYCPCGAFDPPPATVGR